MKVTIYHNPRCSKSRQTLELLVQQGIEPEIVEYLKTPPDKNTLKKILKLLDIGPRDLMRKKESVYKETGLDDGNLDDEQIITAMLKYPVLIERPIVLANGRAAIGRPPESVLDIL
jgi:arsenate reductase